MMRALFVSAVLLGLAACAAPTTTSWVDGPLTASDNKILAEAMVRITRQRLPPANSTITIVPSVGTATSALHDAVADGLRKAGFAVAANPNPTTGAHPLRYMITPLDGQVLLRVSLDATMTTQLFAANTNGHLAPASPQAVQTGATP